MTYHDNGNNGWPTLAHYTKFASKRIQFIGDSTSCNTQTILQTVTIKHNYQEWCT